ncbi:MAG: hypothetical protein JWQ09_1788 [Segetibacter sp.]|nr:hypothetical protein [Segetibacter sp.]
MKYIDLLNQFWLISGSNYISSTQAFLYFCLLQECNKRRWPPSFQISNKLLCAQLGIGEKCLIEARKKLKELNLIDFEGGVTNTKAPTYYLLDYFLKESNSVSNSSVAKGVTKGVTDGTYIKRREDNNNYQPKIELK